MEEHIKETEKDVEEIKDAPVRPVREKHRVRKLIKEMWPAYLIEIFVIILGISITLALEEWRDRSKEKQLEIIYKRNLLTDIEADLRSLQYASENTRQLLLQGNELLAFIKDPSASVLSPARAASDLEGILKRPDFAASDATFSDLKNSGNLHLLQDIRLKNLLFTYYSQTLNIKNVQDAEQQATIILAGPYFFKRFPMGNLQESIFGAAALQALSKDMEFGNNVLLRVGNRRELLEAYQKADSMASHLKNMLSTKDDE